MKKLALVFLLACSAAVPAAGATRLWAGLTPGKYLVGVRTKDDVTTWYPATAGGELMRFRDYVPLLEDLDEFLHAQHTPDETIVELFDSRMFARRDAPAIKENFPLVLIAQGNGNTANDQAILAEYIASHGYVVATIPGPIVKSGTEIAAKAQEQAGALSRIATEDAIVIGHSFGARSMLLYAMKNPARALISLDGGIGTANNVMDVDRTRPLPPILHLYEEADAFMKPDFTFLKSLNAKTLTLEKVDAMHHVHFSSWGFISAAFPEIAKTTKATRGTKRGVTSSAERVVQFIAAQTSRRPI